MGEATWAAALTRRAAFSTSNTRSRAASSSSRCHWGTGASFRQGLRSKIAQRSDDIWLKPNDRMIDATATVSACAREHSTTPCARQGRASAWSRRADDPVESVERLAVEADRRCRKGRDESEAGEKDGQPALVGINAHLLEPARCPTPFSTSRISPWGPPEPVPGALRHLSWKRH